jgi:hypothetical protein
MIAIVRKASITIACSTIAVRTRVSPTTALHLIILLSGLFLSIFIIDIHRSSLNLKHSAVFNIDLRVPLVRLWIMRALNCDPTILRAREWPRRVDGDCLTRGKGFFDTLFSFVIWTDIHKASYSLCCAAKPQEKAKQKKRNTSTVTQLWRTNEA